MSIITKSFIASALVFVLATPASAEVSGQTRLSIMAAAGSSGSVYVKQRGGTLSVFGNVESAYQLAAIRRAAKNSGAERVVIRVRSQN